MANKFVLAINSKFATSHQRDALTSFFEGKGYHVWHWFEDVWLINSGAENPSANAFGPEIVKIIQGDNGYQNGFLLFGLAGDIDMAAFLNANSFPWINKHFKNGEEGM